jgi:hypothetical protein
MNLSLYFTIILAAALNVSAQFTIPGLLNNLQELEFIKERIAAGDEPWQSAFDDMQTFRAGRASVPYASLDYTPEPYTNVECGYYDNPDNGCFDERDDATAAYTHALLWVFTGNEAHAQKAVEILNAWSILEQHTHDNAGLQAGLSGSVFVRGAEIMKATYPQWDAQDIAAFSEMLDRAFIPMVINGKPGFNGNWEFIMIETLMSIAVFNQDTAYFNKAVFLWRHRVPAYFYSTEDGELPVRPYGTNSYDSDSRIISHWHNPGNFVDGLCQETCRDFGHMQMGMSAMINSAEIALHQGLDLYSEFAERIMDGLEFHAGPMVGEPAPDWLCGGNQNISTAPTWEIAYNHFHNRLGHDLPLTRRLIEDRVRPSGTWLHIMWETMTHAELGQEVPVVSTRTGADRVPERGGLSSAVFPYPFRPWIERPVSGGREIYTVNGARIKFLPAQPAIIE